MRFAFLILNYVLAWFWNGFWARDKKQLLYSWKVSRQKMMNGVKQTKDGNWWSELVVNCVMSPLCWDDCNTDFTFSIINLSYFVYFVLTSRGKKSYWTINNKLGSLTYCRTGINHVAYCIVVCEWNLLRFQNCFHLIEYKFLPM